MVTQFCCTVPLALHLVQRRLRKSCLEKHINDKWTLRFGFQVYFRLQMVVVSGILTLWPLDR